MAVIFNDPSHKEWDEWDYKLFKAHYILQDWYRDGIPVWWDESERVTFTAETRISKSRAAIERSQNSASGKKEVPGRYYVAKPVVMDGGEFPTKDEWIKEQESKAPKDSMSTKFGSNNKRNKNIIQGKK